MDTDLTEVIFDDLGWDSFFPCHPEKGVDLSRIYDSRDPRRWQEEDGEQTSSEDEDVDLATRALPLKWYMISEAGGARSVSTTEESQWHGHDEGSSDDFDWDNYVPARLGRYKPTYAFVLTHGQNSLYHDKDVSSYGKRAGHLHFPAYSSSAPHYNTVAIEPRDTKSSNCYVYENFDAEEGRDVLRTVNPQYLMFPPPEDLYQSFNKPISAGANTNPYRHRYQGSIKHSVVTKSRCNDVTSQKKAVRHSGSKTVNNSSFGNKDFKVRPETSGFRLKSRHEASHTNWTKTSRINGSGLEDSSCVSARLGQETNNKENRGNRPPENSESDRNQTTKIHQNATVPEGKRRRVRRFFLGYMKTSDSLNDIKEAIYSHAREQGVELTYVRMMKNERQGVVFARVNVAIEQANIVLKENFWPSDMVFRPWLSKAKYKEQGGTRMPHIEEEHSLEVSC
uniref:Uncharacterized protein n=1 Tax=Branchiostoma floridae TaxID=7739 RepID=C3YBK0_BRAFL|eukprot:XP_002606347.1 hypothetical protein BRAFLDRAFT_118510 [Branchiostoma floridae]